MELKDCVWEALRGVRYPGYRRDIVSFGLVQNVTAVGEAVGIALRTAHLAPSVQQTLEREVREAVVWRGPMLHRALRTFLHEVAWSDLDVLLLDLPPGTRDVALTVAQEVPYAEWVVVTTPQPAAGEVALRAGPMAQKVNLRVAGVVENLSWYRVTPEGPELYLFGRGGGRRAAERLGAPLLAQIPLEPVVRECADRGEPVVWAEPDREVCRIFRALAGTLMAQTVTTHGGR